MPASFVLGFVSCACMLGALSAYLKERRARRWPTVVAQVSETEPQSMFERVGRTYVLNRDSDHFLEWSVNGQAYRIKLEEEGYAVISGFKVWRRAPALEARVLHYNPAAPLEHMLVADFGTWKRLLVIASVAGCIGAIIAIVVSSSVVS